MPRPFKCRRVCLTPGSACFTPAEAPAPRTETVVLTLDEFEALRLADLLGRQQEEAAAEMKISRQTFGNILRSARRKMADFITGGKTLQIAGGEVRVAKKHFHCRHCGESGEQPLAAPRGLCPRCGHMAGHAKRCCKHGHKSCKENNNEDMHSH